MATLTQMSINIWYTNPNVYKYKARSTKFCFSIISQNQKVTRLQCHYLHEKMFTTETDIKSH